MLYELAFDLFWPAVAGVVALLGLRALAHLADARAVRGARGGQIMTAALHAFALLVTASAIAQEDFTTCLARLEREARGQGIGDATIAAVFPTIAPRPPVIAADRSQPEFIDTFRDYLYRRVNDRRIRIGREQFSRQREFLDSLTTRYGVPGQYVLAAWALESDYGSAIGDVPVFDSLATLACDGRRGAYFSAEFVDALGLAEAGHVAIGEMRGSWAGAVGQTQFMPSSYLAYAVDGDGDGRIDLWRNERDALASAAHYLQRLGWDQGWRWGREVLLPAEFDYGLAGRDERRTLAEWAQLGVSDVTSRAIPALDARASVLVPSGQAGPAFLVYDNFEIIMRWNLSEFFALTLGHLADRIAGGGPLAKVPPVSERLSRADIVRLQQYLADRGYDIGDVDGQFGPRSRSALRTLQRDRGLTPDGYVSRSLLAALGLVD